MYSNDKTPHLFKNFFHLGAELDFGNRWLKLSELVPWTEIDALYGKYFSADSGRPAADSRLVCGLFLVKYIKNLSDEEVFREYGENPYIQAFCGREYFARAAGLSSTLLSERRKRLGPDFFDFFEKKIYPLMDEQKLIKVRTQEEKICFISGLLSRIKSLFN